MTRKILCIDIGGSKILTGIMDENGKVLTTIKKQFHHPDKQQVLDSVLEESQKVLADESWKADGGEISAIGVSIPGLTDSERGLWVYAPFSKIHNLNLRDILQEKYHLPVFLANDGNICTVGEKRFGCAKDYSDFLWVTVSNGVGSGVFLNNRIFEGFSKSAGELGHVKVVDYGYPCPCGGLGCLETYAAAPGLVRRYKELSRSEDRMTAIKVSELARAGDPAAKKVFEQEGFYLGKGIASAVNMLNVPLVVIGGGISNSFDLFEESLQKTLHERLRPFLRQ